MDEPTGQGDAPFDPTRRKLCPDGACVGVIGEDGRCRVCGRAEAEAQAGAGPASTLDAVREPAERDGAEAGPANSGEFDSRRRLCDDGSCLGVVGDDGVCRVCGRRSE
jgi:hypothetical protein